MACNCGSIRIVSIGGCCSDRSSVHYRDKEHLGYVPYGIGIGGGDYIEFVFCADCGHLQNFTPIPEPTLKELFAKADNNTDDEGSCYDIDDAGSCYDDYDGPYC